MNKGSGLRIGLTVLLAALFGLGFGLNFGSSNQATYLLPSVRALHPTLWTRDWLVTQTHAYHLAYAELGTLLLRVSPSGLAVAWANVVLIALGVLALHTVLGQLLVRERQLPAFCVVLLLASVTRTQAPGLSYAFSEILQPSTLGSIGLLTAAAALVAGRPLVSGLCLAFGGAFHVNYLLLGLSVFGVACLLGGRERLVSRALAGLGPPLVVLLGFVPFLLAGAGPGVSAEAQHIYQDIRAPHHYCVQTFAWAFASWAGFQLLGVAALLGPVRRGLVFQRRLLSLLVGWWVVIVPAALLSSMVVVPRVRQLFAWRICAHAELLAQVAFAAALVALFFEGRLALANFDRRSRWLAAAGVALLLLGSMMTRQWNATLVVFSLLAAAALIASGALRRIARTEHEGLVEAQVLGALLVTLLAANASRFAHLSRSSNMLSGGDSALTELCTWAQAHTAEDALFLTPPEEEEVRFRCRRAIVVDWKSPPALPAEVLTWFDRIRDVTGRPAFHSDADLVGYEQLDAARVDQLRARYGFDYVVVERGHELNLGATPVFSGQRLVVYALPNGKRATLDSAPLHF